MSKDSDTVFYLKVLSIEIYNWRELEVYLSAGVSGSANNLVLLNAETGKVTTVCTSPSFV
jgi:hypothetical protein